MGTRDPQCLAKTANRRSHHVPHTIDWYAPRYEERERMQFELVMRVRLDLFWETMLPLPRSLGQLEVAVPHMSHCGGINDKFALGGRCNSRLKSPGMVVPHWHAIRRGGHPRHHSAGPERSRVSPALSGPH